MTPPRYLTHNRARQRRDTETKVLVLTDYRYKLKVEGNAKSMFVHGTRRQSDEVSSAYWRAPAREGERERERGDSLNSSIVKSSGMCGRESLMHLVFQCRTRPVRKGLWDLLRERATKAKAFCFFSVRIVSKGNSSGICE